LRALARVNLAAIERNVARLRRALAGDAALCAVVKADGYGHGAAPAARAALAGGDRWLAVAAAREAADLRAQGIEARLLVMGALTPDELRGALECDADVVAWTETFVQWVVAAGGGRVHVKLDTGMGRLGTRDPDEATRIADAIAGAGSELAGAMTHFATADERDDTYFELQLERFTEWASALAERHPGVVVHAANSAALLRQAASHFDMARAGVAIYGLDPFLEDPASRELEPALELRSYVAAVKRCPAGESAGYGRRFVASRDTLLGTLPIGYGDGVRRGLTNNGEVLIRGRRFSLVGTVSMDNITVDLGAGSDVEPGAPAVLIGADGEERITAEDVARRLGTINYEVTCGISARVPREYHVDGKPA
jgi:alanine racemase